MSTALAYAAAALVAIWGTAHVVPTRQVLAGFARVSADNRRVILQEWLAEALLMWGTAAFVIAATAATGTGDTPVWVYRVAADLLLAVGILTALTGGRTAVVWFKICPVVLAVSAALLLTASAV